MINPIDRKLQDIARMYKVLPRQISITAVNFFKENFRAQAWRDRGAQKWKPRKTKTGRKSDTRAVLVKSGRLRRSIRAVSATSKHITIGTDVPYAQQHNEGFAGTVTQNIPAHTRQAHSRKAYTRAGRKVEAGTVRGHAVKAFTRRFRVNIPKRQFVGHSTTLDKEVAALIKKNLDQVLK